MIDKHIGRWTNELAFRSIYKQKDRRCDEQRETNARTNIQTDG